MLTNCTTLQNTAKYDLADGKYKLKLDGRVFKSYIENNEDSITVYILPDAKIMVSLKPRMNNYIATRQKLIRSSLDLDVLTALFKLRPLVKPLPAQLNANFNGNIYFGYRRDAYVITYKKNALNIYNRHINHFGFSSGIFLGVGNTALSPSTTNFAIGSEYDGLIIQKGVAGILAVNKLTIGLSAGFDNLSGTNNSVWIYENKIWFGLMLGLNLN